MAVAGSNMRYVRIFDLPPELPDDSLLSVLQGYGKVDRMVREKFPADLGLDHMFTGVRGVHMNVEKDIPPSVDVAGRKAKIFYEGLKDTCFLCHNTGHRRDQCPQRKYRNRKQEKKIEENPEGNSYAAVLSGAKATSTEQNSTYLDDGVIEVLDEEFLDHPADAEVAEEVEQTQLTICATKSATEKEMQRKENLEKLEEVAYAIKAAIENKTAKDRRAQFANSGTSTGSVPRKKVARKTLY